MSKSSSVARVVAKQVFQQARSGMSSAGLREGPVAFSYLFRQLSVYLRLRPGRSMPSIDGSPLPLSSQGQKMDELARSLAEKTVASCKQARLMPTQLPQVMDELYALSTDPTLMATSTAPSRIAIPPAATQTYRRRVSMGSPVIVARSSSPSRSMQTSRTSEYEDRLQRMVVDLRQLLVQGPQIFGPIPAQKREYVEQLISFIEDYERDYKNGKVAHPFRFSPEEKAELENFSPSFKLSGLDWVEVEGSRST